MKGGVFGYTKEELYLIKYGREIQKKGWNDIAETLSSFSQRQVTSDAIQKHYHRHLKDKSLREFTAPVVTAEHTSKPPKVKSFKKKLKVKDEKVYVYPISDLHDGDVFSDEAKFIRYRDRILEEPNIYVILNGDLCQGSTLKSPDKPYGLKRDSTQQVHYVTHLLQPIADRIIGVTRGTHEGWSNKETSLDMVQWICDNLELDCYDPDSIFISCLVGKIRYNIYATHGWGGGRRKGAPLNKLEDLTKTTPNADIYLIGHIHNMSAGADKTFMFDEEGNPVEHKRSYASSGSFQEWGGYPRRMAMPPVKLGTVRIRLNANRKDVHITL